MRGIPRYWARAEGRTPPDYEGAHVVSVWGWSDEDQPDAERHARQRLTELLDRLRAGQGLPKGYAYGERPLREEIIEELHDDRGRRQAVITRNSYGSLVLNAAEVLFVDVDVPWPTLWQRLARLLGSRKPPPEAATLEQMRQALRDESGGSYRIYRTAAGFRVLATSPTFVPGSDAAERLMRALGADPAFVQLCRVQQSFRARLTPKPWRCGASNPPNRFPRDQPDQQAFEHWLTAYDAACADKATCRFVEEIGWGKVDADARAIVDLHDGRTRASAELPLA